MNPLLILNVSELVAHRAALVDPFSFTKGMLQLNAWCAIKWPEWTRKVLENKFSANYAAFKVLQSAPNQASALIRGQALDTLDRWLKAHKPEHIYDN